MAIEVSINRDGTLTVEDNGRGIPVDKVAKTDLSGVETVFTVLHAGGKFGDNEGYKVSGGLHGVGASVVNALSSWLEVVVYKDGGEYFIRFEDGGHIVNHLKKVGNTTKHGTKVTFKPDPLIFTETTEFNFETTQVHSPSNLLQGTCNPYFLSHRFPVRSVLPICCDNKYPLPVAIPSSFLWTDIQ